MLSCDSRLAACVLSPERHSRHFFFEALLLSDIRGLSQPFGKFEECQFFALSTFEPGLDQIGVDPVRALAFGLCEVLHHQISVSSSVMRFSRSTLSSNLKILSK